MNTTHHNELMLFIRNTEVGRIYQVASDKQIDIAKFNSRHDLRKWLVHRGLKIGSRPFVLRSVRKLTPGYIETTINDTDEFYELLKTNGMYTFVENGLKMMAIKYRLTTEIVKLTATFH